MRLPVKSSALLAIGFSLVAAASTSLSVDSQASVVVIPSTVRNGLTEAQFISSTHGLDGPKLSNINSTAFGEVWYFDAVSEDGKYSVVAFFWASPSPSLTAQLQNEKILSAQVIVREDDDIYSANSVFAETAEIFTSAKGTSGLWIGTGCSFSGSQSLSTYSVNFSSPFEITGSIILESVAPAHYKCSPAEAGVDTQILPNFGWVNAVPDAQTTVDLKINAKNIKFKGIGYHDLTWSNAPFFSKAKGSLFTEYQWAHGRIGPYSIVWLVITGSDGTDLTSGYVSRDGKVLGTPCSNVSVIPQFNTSTRQIRRFFAQIDLGHEGTLYAQLDVGGILINDAGFVAGSGELSGGLSGETFRHAGVASFEYYKSVQLPEMLSGPQ
ncbi:hypothetical protein HHX47_DHR2000589 [Lentinula edodes]|nr:hypothetical protein HHX47_DHR2000589 [Lentinula edodes]